MVANQLTLESFLSQNKTQFIIPVYQRNYDWTEQQCSQLFKDIMEVGSKQDHDTHFIGSIVFIHDGVYTSNEVKPLVIIDGQQRLTTISLLYLALFKYAVGIKNEAKASEINETYIINKFVSLDDSKLKLKQTDNNSKAFKYILTNNKAEEYGEFSRVIENYVSFHKKINEDNFDTVQTGLSRLLFVEISLERGKDDPQRIFESLNSTGLELSQADLIRNYILMGLEPKKQIEIFNNYWHIIEKNAQDEQKNESKVSDLIRDYLTLKNKKIPVKSQVYEEFKEKFQSRDESFYSDVLEEIKNYSKHYNKLINPEKEGDKDIERQLNYVKRLEINVSYPFLLSVYDDYANGVIDKATFVHVLKLVQSFTWRRFVLGLPTNALNKIFMTLYGEIEPSDYLTSIERSLVKKTGIQRFPNNQEIKSALKEKDVYNIQSKNKVYLLELLENHNNREYVMTEHPDISIEHIFPRNPDPKWGEQLDDHEYKMLKEKYLHTIANLTLSGNNGSLGNRPFMDKKTMNVDGKEQGYEFSRLWLNSYLKKIDEWNIMELNRRFDLVVKRFFEIWPYPAIDTIFEDTTEEVNIFEAEDPKNKSLEYFIFKDERIITQEVSKMFYHVIKTLFDENPQLFLTSDLKEYLPLTTDEKSLRTPFPLSNTYFIESNLDNNSKFRRLKRVLNVFECEDDLVLKYR
ncbi:MAG: DUF262 domain-containing protein [Lewinellaceae bacterium]|nr:DUF262 domain-containing protein [Lewinellaceae bacterium]